MHFHSFRHCIYPQPASAGAPVSEWVLICLTGMLPGHIGEVLNLTKAVKPLISHNLRRPGWRIGRSGQKEKSYLLTRAKTPEPPGLFPAENLVGREGCLAESSCPAGEEAGSSDASPKPEQVCSGGRGHQTRPFHSSTPSAGQLHTLRFQQTVSCEMKRLMHMSLCRSHGLSKKP